MDNVWCRRFCFQVKNSRRMKVFHPEFLHQGEQRFENNGLIFIFWGILGLRNTTLTRYHRV